METFNITYNGGTPYKVTMNNEGTLNIFKNIGNQFAPLLTVLKTINPYIMYTTLNNPGAYDPDRYVFRANNSLLLYLGSGKYMYIGRSVYKFTTINNEKIQDFYSPIGNSDVPYSYAVGENNTYLMLAKESIPNSSWIHIPNMEPYTVYYEDRSIGSPFSLEIIDED